MRNFFIILFTAFSIASSGQPNGVIWITGSNTGDGELIINFEYLKTISDSSKLIFNFEDSVLNAIKYLDWDLVDGWSQQEGRTGWNDEDKTLETGLDQGSVLQHGQEVHVRATNKTGLQIDDGEVVYISGAQGNRPTIDIVSDTSIMAVRTIGVATQDISNDQTGYVTIIGLTRNYDTRPFTAGDFLWAGTTPGTLVNTRPSAPNTSVLVAVALNSTESGVICVKPIVFQRLSYLSDVNARGNQTNNHILQWNEDSLFWESRDSIAIRAILYTDTYWDDLKAPFTSQKLGALSKPDFDYANTGLLFPQNDTGEFVSAIMQFSHERKSATDIGPHLHWEQMNANDVVWNIVYKWYQPGAAVPAAWIKLVEVSDAFAYSSGTLHQITSFATIDGSAITGVSSIFKVKVYRDDNVDGGAGGGDALGLEFDIHYQIDNPGSEEPFTKY